MKALKTFCCLALLLTCNCTEQAPEEYDKIAKRSKKYFEEDKTKESKDFIFPDSVMSLPIIATYFEEDAGAHSIMFYTDPAKKFAKVIRYFPDKTILTDDIKCTGENAFVSVSRPEIKYRLANDHINYTCWRDYGGIQFSFDHLRTDRDH